MELKFDPNKQIDFFDVKQRNTTKKIERIFKNRRLKTP